MPANELAIDGGAPVRRTPLPYGRQSIDDEDVAAVVAALRSDYLTTGPRVRSFEAAFAAAVQAPEAVAVSSGTAGLHAALVALGVGPGDEVIVPSLTFVATANAVLYQGATPVIADVDPETLLLDARTAEPLIGPRTRAILAVDYAGQPCDYDALRPLAAARGLGLVADACHALGGALDERPVGTLADLTVFSLHPVKHITSGEGGVVVTADAGAAQRMRTFRHHGMVRPEGASPWSYQVETLGQNYRLTDFQCALAQSQLRHLRDWVARRQTLAARYDRLLADLPAVRPLRIRPGVGHAYHLYVVRLQPAELRVSRDRVMAALQAEGILATLHYPPVHQHGLYRGRPGVGPCPAAEQAAAEILSLPLYPRMTDADQDDVMAALVKVVRAYRR